VTRATSQPTRRIVQDKTGREYVAEVRHDTLTLRPLRSRRGGPADVSIGWGAIYARACLARPKAVRRRVTRGLMATARGRGYYPEAAS